MGKSDHTQTERESVCVRKGEGRKEKISIIPEFGFFLSERHIDERIAEDTLVYPTDLTNMTDEWMAM
jgi:hypothetical protein